MSGPMAKDRAFERMTGVLEGRLPDGRKVSYVIEAAEGTVTRAGGGFLFVLEAREATEFVSPAPAAREDR